jgi:hypothetical protein
LTWASNQLKMMKKEGSLGRVKNIFEKKNGSLPGSVGSPEPRVDLPGRVGSDIHA